MCLFYFFCTLEFFSYDQKIGDFISIWNLIKRQAKSSFFHNLLFFTNFSLIAIPKVHFAFKDIRAFIRLLLFCWQTNRSANDQLKTDEFESPSIPIPFIFDQLHTHHLEISRENLSHDDGLSMYI